ncbi:hypothetical protein BH11CYA1_BH11CYA1_13490 [soil metagenome]
MLLKKIGVIKELLLPPEFVQGEQEFGGKGNNWRLSYHPRKFKDTDTGAQIILYFRGKSPYKTAGDAFRVFLAQSPTTLFDSTKDKNTRPISSMLKNLGESLGPAANNQLLNKEEPGLQGPLFFLQKVAVALVNKRKVLALTGIYHASDVSPEAFEGHPLTSYYHGLLFDSAPGSQPCCLEELVMQAPTAALLEQYMPSFEKAVASIRWNDL